MTAKKKWIKDAIKHPGSLHKALHVKKGTTISAKKLSKGAHSKSQKIRKEVALAKTLSKLRKK